VDGNALRGGGRTAENQNDGGKGRGTHGTSACSEDEKPAPWQEATTVPPESRTEAVWNQGLGVSAAVKSGGSSARSPDLRKVEFGGVLRGGARFVEVYHDATIGTARPLSVTDVHKPVVSTRAAE
jgi:hypothetical protein